MSEPARKLATYEDLERFPEEVHAEILNGEIYVSPSALPRHGRAAVGVIGSIGMPFDIDPKGPGGWWILTEIDVELTRHDVVRPDVCGWRRERVPVFPQSRPVRIAPDWICEVTSPSNVRHDRLTKAQLYARCGVPFYWIVDPAARLLEAFELSGAAWVRFGAWGDGDVARVRPFDTVELDVGTLFPPSEPGELIAPLGVSEAVALYGA
ncbi:MAG TPA: Uma2 family endonuclease [Thermoanaerobaculia bacterium]|nr:Uma2 family endonuclease [Thermoanaerobaculia bacterium]